MSRDCIREEPDLPGFCGEGSGESVQSHVPLKHTPPVDLLASLTRETPEGADSAGGVPGPRVSTQPLVTFGLHLGPKPWLPLPPGPALSGLALPCTSRGWLTLVDNTLGTLVTFLCFSKDLV